MSAPGIDSATLRFAAAFSSAYVVWLKVFEGWLEPRLRHGLGAVLGCRVVWVPALGAYRVWGVEPPSCAKLEAKVGLVGSAVVLCGALVPMIAPVIIGYEPARNTQIGATHCLLSLPMAGYFLLRVLRRAHPDG
jgi:hypothetical protein